MNLLDSYVRVLLDDQVSSKLDSIVTGAVAKGQTLANAFSFGISAIQNAAGAVYNFGSSIIGAYSQFEQNVGGIETLFKNAADTVIENSRRAFESAGVSMNQYMQQATSLASAMIQGVTKANSTAIESDTKSIQRSLDAQYKAQQRAFSRQATEFQRQLSDEYEARQKAFQREYQAAQEANAREVEDFNEATEKRISIMEREYEKKVSIIDRETKARLSAIDEQIKALEDQGEAEDDAAREADRADKIAELNKRVETEKTYKKRQEAAQELSEYLAKIDSEDRDRERKKQIESLKEQKDEVTDAASERKSQLQKQYSDEVAQYKESRSELLREIQKNQQEQLQNLQEAQQEQLKMLQRSQQDQMTAFREAQQDQLEALQESIAARKEALKNATDDSNSFVEASAEDYERAAQLVDLAIVDMSDNANKMGTDLGMIQAAYQGFSKSNFTMLDNLKLGFGGTKSEMERLLDTAEQIKAKGGETVDYSIDNLADIVEAIHTVQTEYEVSGYSLDEITQKLEDQSLTEQDLRRVAQDMGITYEEALEKMKDGSLKANDAIILTGTTSKEANSTIEGSLRSMGAAWENWLVAVADADPEKFEKATDDIIDRVAIAMSNIVPRAGVILANLATFVAERAPTIFDELKTAFFEALPDDEAREKFGEYFEVVAGAVDAVGGALDLMQGASGIISDIISYVIGNWDDISATLSGIGEGLTTIGDFFDWINENKDTIITAVAGITGGFVAFKAALAIAGLIEALGGAMGIATAASTLLNGGIFTLNTTMMMNPIAIVIGLIAGLVAAFITAYNTSDEFREKVDHALGIAKEAFEGLFKGAKKVFDNLGEMFKNLPQNILDWIGDVGDLLTGIGSTIMDSLISGLQGGLDDLGGALGEIGGFIIEHKGPPSYDKVMLRKNGQLIMGGLIDSIEDEIPNLGLTLSHVNEAITGGIGASPTVEVSGAGGTGVGRMFGGVSVQVGELVVREEADINRIADQLYTKIKREQEAYGWSTSFTMA